MALNLDVICKALSLTVLISAIRSAGRKHRNGWKLTKRLSQDEWRQQVVVITGGAGGVGNELCRLLSKKGAQVVVLDIGSPPDSAKYTRYIRCDVASAAEVEKAAKQISDEVGPVSILINNAGVLNGKLLLDLSVEDVQKIIGVNLTSHFWTMKAFLPDMIKKHKGHIVTVSSVMGHIGIPHAGEQDSAPKDGAEVFSLLSINPPGDYVATKHALVGLHESLRYELDVKYRSPEVRTTLVCPGHIQTPMFSGLQVPPLARFLAPLLSSGQVAAAIVEALDRQESTDIYLPWYAQWTPLLRMFPSFLRDLAQTVSGANHAIEDMCRARAEKKQ
ncbi:hypothetical protein OC861_001395 [Tilletia horrida]|nr:hypothetical protein OC861_001395 [Tilletia horrida]